MLDDEPAGVEKSESQLNDYFNSSTKVRIFIHIPHIFNVKRVKKDIYNSRIFYPCKTLIFLRLPSGRTAKCSQ